jgi:uncharacterized protein YndB with AHSA1/START domain
MLKKIAIGLALLIAVVMVLATQQPDTFSVVRTTSVKATPDKVFAAINDFHNWDSWSPWAKLDPAMKTTYSGAASGPGAVYEWTGNSDVGSGRMEITEASAPSKVTIKLDFITPIEGHNMTTFDMIPSGEMTNVTWTMTGPMPFASKVMSVFTTMDALIGGDFEKGLATLKTVSEK